MTLHLVPKTDVVKPDDPRPLTPEERKTLREANRLTQLERLASKHAKVYPPRVKKVAKVIEFKRWDDDPFDRMASEFCGMCGTRHHPEGSCQPEDAA